MVVLLLILVLSQGLAPEEYKQLQIAACMDCTTQPRVLNVSARASQPHFYIGMEMDGDDLASSIIDRSMSVWQVHKPVYNPIEIIYLP